MKAALYARVSTIDQNPQSQLLDLQQLAQQRGMEIVETYIDHGVSGARARRPALDKLLADAARHRFDVVVVWSFDRMARSVKHLLDILDTLNHLAIGFVSLRENIDSSGPLGRAIFVIVGAISELERSLIIERVKCGMRRAKLEGRHIGRRPLDIDRSAVLGDRTRGLSLAKIAKLHGISRSMVSKIVRDAAGHKGSLQPSPETLEIASPKTAA